MLRVKDICATRNIANTNTQLDFPLAKISSFLMFRADLLPGAFLWLFFRRFDTGYTREFNFLMWPNLNAVSKKFQGNPW